MLIGYVRVSTNDHKTDFATKCTELRGCEWIFEDKVSGTQS